MNISLHYERKGEGPPFIMLHGWGASSKTFEKLSNTLSELYQVYVLDLPGFGKSEIGVPLAISDVSEILHEFCVKLDIQDPIILGHSYGGRIAIAYASKYSVRNLILVSSAGIKQKLKLSKRFKVKIYKMMKKLHLPVKMGSTDYQNADNIKRIMLVQAVNKDLKENMKLIKCPTLLLYGKNDTVTPLKMAYEIKECIPNSFLIELDDCGHFPYLDRPSYFTIILMSYLTGETNGD